MEILRQDKANLSRSLYVKPQSIASTSNTTFDGRYKHKLSESFLNQPEHHLGLKAHNFANPIFTFGCFCLKAVYNLWKLHRLLQVAKFLFMYSFTRTNIV